MPDTLPSTRFLDNSTLEALLTCPRSYEYKHIAKRTAAFSRPGLNFGGCIHRCLKYRYQRCGARKPTDKDEANMNAIASAHLRRYPQPVDDFRQLSLAHDVLGGYNTNFGNEPFTVIETNKGKFVEFSFALELETTEKHRYFYTGKIDLAVFWDNELWVMDHKTSSVFGEQFFMEQRLSEQMWGYCWAIQKVLGRRPAGYVINAIRIRPPAKSRSSVIDDDFQRQRYYIEQWHIDDWRESLHEKLLTLERYEERNHYPQHHKWCVAKYGRCEYYDVCDLPPSQRATMLASNIYQPNTWSPLCKA